MFMDMKTLAKLADLCRKKGIESIKIQGETVEFKLSENLPTKKTKKVEEKEEKLLNTPTYTPEEALFWSSAGIPDEESAN